ncbi:MAG: porin [Nitrosomonadales bacterium]|nr:porin [Nitrosomonadales bacterium]
MKKSLIALAVAGAFVAPAAFADTTVYGVVDAAIASVSGTGERSQTLAVSGGLASSRLGVKGSEDLGGGLTAVYQAEFSLDSQDNSGIGGARQKLLGVAGSFGTVATGYLQTAGWDFSNKFDPTAGSSVSSMQNMNAGNFLLGQKGGAERAQRALAYISPNMEGFTVAVNHVTALSGTGNLGLASATPDANVTANLFAANYEAGPLAVGGVYGKTSNPVSTNNDRTDYALGASYDVGAAKLFGTYQSTKLDATGANGNNNKLYSISGVIPAGPGAAVLSYAKSTIGTDTSGNSNGSGYTAAYLYTLSKTATAYAAYAHTSNSSNATYTVDNNAVGANLTAGGSSSIVALGLKKSF